MGQDDREPTPAGPAESKEPAACEQGNTTGPREAWRDVVVQLDALGESVGAWTRAAINDPENRRHAAEIRAKLEAMTRRVASTVDDASKTEVGSAVVEGAEKTGQVIADASGKVADAATPHVVSALSGLAGVFGKAAEKVGRAAEKSSEGTPDAAVADAADETKAPDPEQH